MLHVGTTRPKYHALVQRSQNRFEQDLPTPSPKGGSGHGGPGGRPAGTDELLIALERPLPAKEPSGTIRAGSVLAFGMREPGGAPFDAHAGPTPVYGRSSISSETSSSVAVEAGGVICGLAALRRSPGAERSTGTPCGRITPVTSGP